MRTKPWYRSKTIRLNLIVAILLAIEANLQLLQPLLPVNIYAATAFVLTVLNVGLRIVSAASITLRPSASEIK